MNFPGLVLSIGLLVAGVLTEFSWASHEKPVIKDDDLNANDRSQQEAHGRMAIEYPHIERGKECLTWFSVNEQPPTFPAGDTVAICQRVPESTVAAEFATLFDRNLGIPRYSIYALDPVKVERIGKAKRKDKWHKTAGIVLQGSNKMYKKQPGSPKYHRGHVAPFNILSYSAGSGLASFAYTNAVPQVDKSNISPWKKYEGRIVKYAQRFCAPKGGTLHLITGISEARIRSISEKFTGLTVIATRTPMPKSFPPHNQNITPKIAIPNSMWTVGCCVKAGQVLGAFAGIGNNLPKPPDNLMHTNLGVAKVEKFIRVGANDPNIQLFPGNADCYNTNQHDLSLKPSEWLKW